jgi:NADPH:quinone reductase-like Zn-dependent oxidoreductase
MADNFQGNDPHLSAAISESRFMKAIMSTGYGLSPEVLQLAEVDMPVPKDNEVLVKIVAASANTLDLQIKGGLTRLWGGFRKPRDHRLGRDIAGLVEAVGSRVTQFQPGDEVFGVCDGAFAEYAAALENKLALKPANSSNVEPIF